ncbi:hypothetical protein Slala03_55470 [Streptomyces lavendulae subsp. lavendulae]|uniref:hypothetical protein n=1 Tax=Streptomyces lavendulae TaxID=1914 RepID=UPI0024A44A5F|nr:hypothetical protein [Streptomyces lavendulae]GLV85858.1 hypothetical protein Slala03_55470 [Streptomyces lavendulae subsp. lavendulae]
MLHAECSCGWTGTRHTVDRIAAGDVPIRESGLVTAERCEKEWHTGTISVGNTTVPLLAEPEELLLAVAAAIENLGRDAPTTVLKAARTLGLIAEWTAYWPAYAAPVPEPRRHTRSFLDRYDGWSPYG